MSKYSKYSIEERIAIGQKIIEQNIPYAEAARVFAVSYPTIANYVKMYRDSIGDTGETFRHKSISQTIQNVEMDYLSNLSKEELINEVIRAKVGEARAKKGYKVKGGGQSKEFVTLSKENIK